MEELAAEVLNRLLGSATSIQTVRGDGEPVSNLILRQKSPPSLSPSPFLLFFLSSWGPDEAGVSVASESNENGEKKRGVGKGAN